MIRASIIGASGYVGGELLRLLIMHPEVEVVQATSERYKGKPVSLVHPNLRSITNMRFESLDNITDVDVIFSALPHCNLMNLFNEISAHADRLIDLSADFRIKDASEFKKNYGISHPNPEILDEFVYGIVELHRDGMRSAKYISSAGCNATVTILSLWPLIKNDLLDSSFQIVAEAKCGSSEGGNKFSEASHHPERSGCVRSYSPVGHRHIAEMRQELGRDVLFSATSIDMVRGILVTAHATLREGLGEIDVWKAYRKEYGVEPFVRIVKSRSGLYRYPEPKLLAGTNFCDIGFAVEGRRIVVIGAIDNLMKGAAGQAVHAMNIMYGFDEKAGLEFCGLHPI